jgi:sugar phosphate permease
MSVLCCAFGALALAGPSDYRSAAYGVNIVLAITCFFVAGRDLKARGWALGYLFAGAYVLPLIGLIVYFALSDRPKVEGASLVGG